MPSWMRSRMTVTMSRYYDDLGVIRDASVARDDERPVLVPHERRGRDAQVDQKVQRRDLSVDAPAVLEVDDRERSEIDNVASNQHVCAAEEHDAVGV